MNGMIIVLAGPSGAGKSRVFDEIAKQRDNVRKVLSVTTRARREGETLKPNYIYVSKQKFQQLVAEGQFFEWEEYDDNFYGTLEIPVQELSQKDLFFDKDVRGAISIKKAYPEAITIYIMPKDKVTLEARRGNRGAKRADIAKGEVEPAKQLDFLVINDDINDTVRKVEEIIEFMRNYSMKNKSSIKFLDEFY